MGRQGRQGAVRRRAAAGREGDAACKPPPAGRRRACRAAPAPDAKDAQKGRSPPAEQDAEFRKRKQEAAKDREKQAQAEQEADGEARELRARAGEQLRALESGQRIARTDAKGERYYLDEAQIAQRDRQGAQARRSSACS